jgi:hypothetical protein
MVSYLHVLWSHFIAHLRPNSFAIIVTAFTLTPIGRASIRAAEQGFQTQGHVDEVMSRGIVMSMCKEFESILASGLDFIFENPRPAARPAFRALPWDAGLDAMNSVPLDSLPSLLAAC